MNEPVQSGRRLVWRPRRAHSTSAAVAALLVVQTGLSSSFCIEVQYFS